MASGVNIKFTAQETEVISKLRAMGGETAKLVEENIRLAQSYAEVDAKSKFFARGIERQKSEVKSLSNTLKAVSNEAATLVGLNLSGPLAGIGGALGGGAGLAVGVGIDTLVSLGKEVVSVTEKYDRLQIALDNITGSTKKGAEAFEFLRQLSDKTGQRLDSLADIYKGFSAAAKGTALEGAGIAKVFDAFIKGGTSMKLSNEQIERSLRAVSQMLGKGKIQAEELTTQFAEAFPGGVKLFADALGISTAELYKLSKAGDLVATDVLPRVAAHLEKTTGETYAKNLQTITGSMNRLKNETDLLLVALGRSSEINKFFANFNNGLADAIAGFRELQNNKGFNAFMSFVGSSIEGASLPFTMGIRALGAYGKNAQANKRTGFSAMTEEGRNKVIFNQIALVNKLKKEYEGLLSVYAATGQKESEMWRKQSQVSKAEKTLDFLVSRDRSLTAAQKPTSGQKPFSVAATPTTSSKATGRMGFSKEYRDVIQRLEEEEKLQKAASKKIDSAIADAQEAIAKSRKYGAQLGELTDVSKWLPSAKKSGNAKMMVAGILPDKKDVHDQLKDWLNWYEEAAQTQIKETDRIHADVKSALTDSLAQEVGNGISSAFEAIASGKNPFKAFGDEFVQQIGAMLTQMGTTLLSTAIPVLALGPATGGLTVPQAKRMILAGGAFMTAGGALRATKFAEGGILRGRVFAEMGEYAGVRNNPEVITPLNKLGGLLEPFFAKTMASHRTDFGSREITVNSPLIVDGRVLAMTMNKVELRNRKI